MARYIDADVLCEHLRNKLKTDYEMGLYNHGALTESFIRFVERQPTANVAPIADTVRKMQERLKAESITIQDHTGKLGSVVLIGTIDQIAKEMVEGDLHTKSEN